MPWEPDQLNKNTWRWAWDFVVWFLNIFWASVLVISGCCNKIPYSRWLKQQKFPFLPFWRLGNPRERSQLVGSSWGPFSGLLGSFVLTWPPLWFPRKECGGAKGASSQVSLLIRAPVPSHKRSASYPNYLPKAPVPNTITLGGKASTYEFGGNTDIQVITVSQVIPISCQNKITLLGTAN